MNWKQIRKTLMIFGTIIGFLIFLYLLIDGSKDFKDYQPEISFNWMIMFFALLVLLSVYFLQMVNLWLIIKTYYNQVMFLSILRSFSLALIPKYVPGYIWGYVSRGEWLLENSQIPLSVSWVGSIIEIIITLMSGGIIVLINYLSSKIKLALSLLIVILLVLLGYFLTKYGIVLLGKIATKKLDQKIKTFPSFKHWLVMMGNSLIQWTLLGLAFWLIQLGIFSVHSLIDFSLLFEYSSIFSLAWLSGFITIFVPNGLGIREIVLSELLIEKFSFSFSTANLTSVMSRVLLFITEGIWFVIALGLTVKKSKPSK